MTQELGEYARRLNEKHRRAVSIKAATKRVNGVIYFHYDELVYCQQPSIERFIELVRSRNIMFEFLIAEQKSGIRNHGYPWRLGHANLLDSLFSMQVKLR